MFDINYFLKQGFDIDRNLVKKRTGKKFSEVIGLALKRIDKMKTNEVLFGLGDLLDNKMKDYVKKNLVEDVRLELKMLVN